TGRPPNASLERGRTSLPLRKAGKPASHRGAREVGLAGGIVRALGDLLTHRLRLQPEGDHRGADDDQVSVRDDWTDGFIGPENGRIWTEGTCDGSRHLRGVAPVGLVDDHGLHGRTSLSGL